MSGENHRGLALNRHGSESTKARDVTRAGKERAKYASRLQGVKRPGKEQKGNSDLPAELLGLYYSQ